MAARQEAFAMTPRSGAIIGILLLGVCSLAMAAESIKEVSSNTSEHRKRSSPPAAPTGRFR
jgi:hypothetical protein